MYEPREDSYLLKKHIKDYARGDVLEIGTGSGILAKETSNYSEKVIAVDLDKEAIKYAIKHSNNPNISYLYSDMFQNVKSKYDLIICNPPYLPTNEKAPDTALDGGKKGWEWSEKFLSQANNFLKTDGKILFLFSSLTNKDKIDELIFKYGFESKKIDEEKLFFEKLYVYLLEKTRLTKELESKKITNISYFSKGRRGVVWKAKWKHKDVIIKSTNPNSTAFNRIQNEINILNRLNKQFNNKNIAKGLSPKILFHGDNYFAYAFIDGIFFQDYIKKEKKMRIKKVLNKLFDKLYALDEFRLNKCEMTRPIKHILIENNTPYLIDFERAVFTENPKNVSQFVQFLLSKNILHLLENKGFKIDKESVRNVVIIYKKNINKKDLYCIKKCFK